MPTSTDPSTPTRSSTIARALLRTTITLALTYAITSLLLLTWLPSSTQRSNTHMREYASVAEERALRLELHAIELLQRAASIDELNETLNAIERETSALNEHNDTLQATAIAGLAALERCLAEQDSAP